MEEIGAYEAKTHLSRLLDRVSAGERIIVTRHGAPVATLVPAGSHSGRSVAETIQHLRRFRKGRTLGELSIRELIEEGRRS